MDYLTGHRNSIPYTWQYFGSQSCLEVRVGENEGGVARKAMCSRQTERKQ